MNAIDLIDQYVGYHERHQRQYKWGLAYMYTAFRLAASTISNLQKVFYSKIDLYPSINYMNWNDQLNIGGTNKLLH